MSPANLDAINEFFSRYNNHFVWASSSFIPVPQQHMNDCGPFVNELMRRLMMNEAVVDFELHKAVGVRLRITQRHPCAYYKPRAVNHLDIIMSVFENSTKSVASIIMSVNSTAIL